MSHSAMSRPVIAPEPTVPVMPWPMMAVIIFCHRRSMCWGSSPISSAFRSCTAVSITRGHPEHSPMPVTPSSVYTLTNSQLRVPVMLPE